MHQVWTAGNEGVAWGGAFVILPHRLRSSSPQQQVWEAWTESELRQWLIDHDVIKSDAQIKKEKLQKLVAYVPIPLPILLTSKVKTPV